MSFNSINFDQKMSSVEIAELCGKRHDNVLADIRKAEKQGACDLSRFEEVINYTNGKGGEQQRTVYNLPFVETMTLISGYNGVLRSKIIRRWTVLERKEAEPTLMGPAQPAIPESKTLSVQISIAKMSLSLAKAYGLEGDQALICADKACYRITQFSPLKYLGHPVIISFGKGREVAIIPTKLGERIGASAIEMNRMLADAGFQEKRDDQWYLLEEGKRHAKIINTVMKHTRKPVKQIKWFPSVLNYLKH